MAVTLVSLPLVFFGIVYLSWAFSGKYLRIIISILTVSTSLQFAVANTKFSFTNQLSWDADKQLAIRLQSRIDELNIIENKQTALEIVGVPEARSPKIFRTSQTIGKSFFALNGGNINRIVLFLNTLGIQHYRAATILERKQILSQTHEMPAWPSPESVSIKDNILVVKFGEYSYQQHRKLCVTTNQTPPKGCK